MVCADAQTVKAPEKVWKEERGVQRGKGRRHRSYRGGGGVVRMSTDGYGFVRRHALGDPKGARGSPENTGGGGETGKSRYPCAPFFFGIRPNPYPSVSPGGAGASGVSPGCGKPRLTVLCRVSSKKRRPYQNRKRILEPRAPHAGSADTPEPWCRAFALPRGFARGARSPTCKKTLCIHPRRPQSAESAPLHRQPGGHISLILRMTMPIQAMSRGCTGMIRPSGLSLVSSSW